MRFWAVAKLVLIWLGRISGIAAATAAGIYTYYAGQQWGIMREQLKSQDRPWVGVSQLVVVRPLARNAAMQVNVRLKNWGKSPALYIVPHVILVPVFPKQTIEELLNAHDRTCLQAMPNWDDTREGFIVFPDEDDSMFPVVSLDVGLTPSQIDFLNAVPGATSAPAPSLGIWLLGCIDYFDQHKFAHRTRFCRFFIPDDPAHPWGFCPYGNSGT